MIDDEQPRGERKYIGYVKRTQDKNGRVKVFIPGIHAENTPVGSLPDAWPSIPGVGPGYGMFAPVQDGAQVWVDFNPETGRCIYQPGPAAAGEIPPEFQDHQAFGFKTPSGHVLALVDRGGEEAIYLKTAQGHKVNLSDAGKKVEVETSGGHQATLDDGGAKITLKHTGGAKTEMEAAQITHTAPQVKIVGNLLIQGSITTTGGGTATIDGTITGNAALQIQGDIQTASKVIDQKGDLTNHTNQGLARD